jgi:hypothetical protein
MYSILRVLFGHSIRQIKQVIKQYLNINSLPQRGP